MTFTVRQATLRDLPALRWLWSHLWDAIVATGAPITFDADDLDRMTVDLAHALATGTFVVFLAEDEAGAPLGMIVGEIQTRRYGSPKSHAYVAAVWVEPEHRNAHIANELGIAFLAWGRQFDGVEHGEYVASPGLDTPLQWWRDAFGARLLETRYMATFAAVDAVVNQAARASTTSDQDTRGGSLMGGISQNLSHQTSNPTLVRPFGGDLPSQSAGRFNNQFARPFAQAFGFNTRPGFERRLAAGAAAGNPMATYLTQARGVVGNQIPQAQAIGSEIQDRARSGYTNYENSVNDFMAQLPGFQNQINADRAQSGKDFQSGRNALGESGDTLRSALAGLVPARAAIDEGMGTTRQGVNQLGTAGATLDQTGKELDTATGYGQQAAAEAFSPLQSRALFQEAAQRAQNALGGQQALTGMVGQGGGGAAQQDMLTNMAMQAMQNEGQNQRESTSLLGDLAGRRTNLGTAQTGLGTAYGNIGAQQGELGSRYGELASREGEIGGRQTDLGRAYGDIGSQYGETMNNYTKTAADIAKMGPEQMQQLFQAQPQLAAQLILGQQLPMQTAGQLQSFLQGQFSPTMDIAQLTKPQMGQESKGTSGGQSVSVGGKGGGGG